MSGLPWFRLYAEFATDPKVQMLSESDQRRYIMLLCLRCSNGDVTLRDEEIAFQLRIAPEDWTDTKALFIDRKLIDDANRIVAWDKRQFVSDISKERVRKHRDKKRQKAEQERNVTVTPPDKDSYKDSYKERSSSLRSESSADANRPSDVTAKMEIIPPNAVPDIPAFLDQRSSGDTNFDQLWSGWGCHKTPKGSKKEAFDAWKKHVVKADVPPAEVLERVDAYCRQCRRTDTKTQHVCNWLKGHRWEDDYDDRLAIDPHDSLAALENAGREI